MKRYIYNKMSESVNNAAESAPVTVGSLLGRVKWFRNGPDIWLWIYYLCIRKCFTIWTRYLCLPTKYLPKCKHI